MPLLSIAIPAYNYAHYLPQALASCAGLHPEVEVVVLDNASTDGTEQLRSRFEALPNVVWSRNASVLPQQDNFNRCVQMTRGKFVKLLPADDYLLPGALDRILAWLKAAPTAHFHGHLAHVVDSDGSFLREQRPYTADRSPVPVAPEAAIPGKLRQFVRFKEPTCNVFSREAFDAVGGYENALRFAFDVQLNMRIASRFPSVLWSESVVALRRHVSSVGARLAPSIGVGDIRALVSEWRERCGDRWAPGDARAAKSFLQYRVMELILQRCRRQPAATWALLRQEWRLLIACDAWPQTFGTLWRRARHGDVQRTVATAAQWRT
jgi:glycosyltransferase involved in cell wall biosynthesis